LRAGLSGAIERVIVTVSGMASEAPSRASDLAASAPAAPPMSTSASPVGVTAMTKQ
jgi:hypothetical protein